MAVNISAAMVNELRTKTGQAMMECKKMLTETGGDIEQAITRFREKGVKMSIQERAATEGKLHAATSADGQTGAVVVINCNTDFTAKSEPVQRILELAVTRFLANPTANVAEDADVKQQLTQVSQTTGENVQLGKAMALRNPAGKVGSYVYAINGKIGVLMSLNGNASDELVRQLGGHIAFARPLGLTREDVPADVVQKEREIAIEQAKQTGKPQQIAEKIAEGKLNSFFAERVLLDQEFFNAGVFKGAIKDMLKQAGVTLNKYVRVEVGQP